MSQTNSTFQQEEWFRKELGLTIQAVEQRDFNRFGLQRYKQLIFALRDGFESLSTENYPDLIKKRNKDYGSYAIVGISQSGYNGIVSH